MRALVFLKSILDPEAPPGAVGFSGRAPQARDVKHVLGPFESNALELAAKLRDAGGSFAAVALGGKEQEGGLRKALAIGAGRALHLRDEGLHRDPLAVATVLAAAAADLGGADVYLFGRQAGDYDQAVTPGLFAGILGIPFVPLVQSLEPSGTGLRLHREIPGGYEEVLVQPPVVLSATNGPATLLRLPRVKDVMLASRSPIEAQESPPASDGLELMTLSAASSGRAGRKLEGDVAELAAALAAEIRRALPGLGGGAA